MDSAYTKAQATDESCETHSLMRTNYNATAEPLQISISISGKVFHAFTFDKNKEFDLM